MNAYSMLKFWADTTPDSIFLKNKKHIVTYKEALILTNKISRRLLQSNITIGDRISFLSKNNPEAILITIAAAAIGATVVPVDSWYTKKQIEIVLNNSDTCILFCEKQFSSILHTIKNSTYNTIDNIVIIDSNNHTERYSLEAWLGTTSAANLTDLKSEDNIWIYIYASGTTGPSKAVAKSQKSLIDTMLANHLYFNSHSGERWLITTILFHLSTINILLNTLYTGGSLYIMENSPPEEVINTIVNDKINYVNFSSPMLSQCINACTGERPDFSHLKIVRYFGAPTSVKTIIKAYKTFKCSLIQGYGCNECGIISTLTIEEHQKAIEENTADETILSSCGKPVMGISIKIVDNDGDRVEDGIKGEIVVKTSQIMAGYVGMNEKTDEVLKNGWFFTGDIGYIDSAGRLHIIDRKKDTIICQGSNVYSKMVEHIIQEHPSIIDVAVIGIPDQAKGEAVKALIIKEDQSTITEREIIDFCSDKLADYQMPDFIDFIDFIPRNKMGKISKYELRKKYV